MNTEFIKGVISSVVFGVLVGALVHFGGSYVLPILIGLLYALLRLTGIALVAICETLRGLVDLELSKAEEEPVKMSGLHYKGSHGYERWSTYDDNDNLIHYKDSDGDEESYL